MILFEQALLERVEELLSKNLSEKDIRRKIIEEIKDNIEWYLSKLPLERKIFLLLMLPFFSLTIVSTIMINICQFLYTLLNSLALIYFIIILHKLSYINIISLIKSSKQKIHNFLKRRPNIENISKNLHEDERNKEDSSTRSMILFLLYSLILPSAVSGLIDYISLLMNFESISVFLAVYLISLLMVLFLALTPYFKIYDLASE